MLDQECMRNAVVMDTDGSSEYSKVKLIPSNWFVPLCTRLMVHMGLTLFASSGHGSPGKRPGVRSQRVERRSSGALLRSLD
jgi:hypothetical protein